MRMRARPGFTLFQLLVLLALLALLFALFLPALLKVRVAAARSQSQNNLKQLALACHIYNDQKGSFPPGNDANNFSASAYLLPYIEQDAVFNLIDFKKPCTDKANARVRGLVIKTFLDPADPRMSVEDGSGATNYLFNAGSEPSLKDDNGVFYQDSKVKFADITDGTSNTLLAGATLKGDGSTKATDVRRQYVLLKAEALKQLTDDSGAKEWKDGKDIAGDRCARWIDGRFLQGTFTGTRTPNDPRPDVSCGGQGGLSALRSMDGPVVNVALCDGSVRVIAKSITLEVWRNLSARNDGNVIPNF